MLSVFSNECIHFSAKSFILFEKFTTHITKSSSSGSGVIESCLDMLFRRRLALSPEATFEKPTAAPIACPASSRCSIEKESSLIMLETLIFRSIWAFAWIRPLDLFLVIWKQKKSCYSACINKRCLGTFLPERNFCNCVKQPKIIRAPL